MSSCGQTVDTASGVSSSTSPIPLPQRPNTFYAVHSQDGELAITGFARAFDNYLEIDVILDDGSGYELFDMALPLPSNAADWDDPMVLATYAVEWPPAGLVDLEDFEVDFNGYLCANPIGTPILRNLKTGIVKTQYTEVAEIDVDFELECTDPAF